MMRRSSNSTSDNSQCSGALAQTVAGKIKTFHAVPRRLTAAEKKVLELVTLAKTNKEIARNLGISHATVKRHLENILRKLALKNRVEAAIFGLSIKGCPLGVVANCPLQAWHHEKHKSVALWAE